MATDKQITANGQNAKKSTGPKTPEGKEAAKMNAIIHGMLSTHLFIPTSADTTDMKGFTDFTGLFFEEMQPEGIVETLLVDRLLATFWRIRRLHIAETGYIRKQVELHYVQQAVDKFSAEGNARKDIEHGFFRRMRTSMGCTHLAYGWQAVAETIQEKGLPLSKGMTRSILEELGGNSGFWMAEYVSQFNWIMQNKEGSKPMSAEEERKFTAYTLDDPSSCRARKNPTLRRPPTTSFYEYAP